MSLRARLTLYFIIIIVVLPVTAVTAYGWHAVARSTQRQIRSELQLARNSAAVAFDARLERAHGAVATLARDPALLQALAAGDGRGVQAVLRRQRVADLLLAVTDADARVLGRAGNTTPGFLPGVQRAPLGMLLPPRPNGVRSRPLRQRRSADLRQRGCAPASSRRCLLGRVTAGIWMDSPGAPVPGQGALDADLTLVVGDRPVASTIGRLTADDRAPAANGIRRGTLAGRRVVMSTEPLTSEVGEQARLLVSIPATPTTAGVDSRLLAIVLLGLVVVCLVATLLGSALARLVSRPSASWPPRPGRSPGAISPALPRGPAPATASGTSTSLPLSSAPVASGPRLRAHAGRARRVPERPALQPRRAGPLHGPAGRDPVLDPRPAQAAGGGAGGGRPGPAGQGGQPAAAHPGPHGPGPRGQLRPGRARAGRADPGRPGRRRHGGGHRPGHDPGQPRPATACPSRPRPARSACPCWPGAGPGGAQPGRPRGRRAVHPLRRRGPDRLRRAGGGGHREPPAARRAERLSVTDPLTGARNYRYFKRRFQHEIERSRRFGLVMALLMLDIDHFRSVNDRFGHQRGDEVLIELARRVTGSVRDIDTFAATAARSSC